jgi:hypothetical protein
MGVSMDEWKIEWGEIEIPVTAEMVVSAMDKGISTVYKALADNKTIRSDARMKSDWEKGALILELVRKKFEGLAEIAERRTVKMKIPGDRDA